MKKYFILFLFLPLMAGDYPKKPVKNQNPLLRTTAKPAANIDRKYGDHSGNRALCRFFNFGGIGDAGGSFSGIYPIGSGQAFLFEFTPEVAASVVDSAG